MTRPPESGQPTPGQPIPGSPAAGSSDLPPVARPRAGSRVVSTERELAEALADPTLGALAVVVDAATVEPLRVTGPLPRKMFVFGYSRVHLGGGSWIEVHAAGHAHVETWDGRVHATETAQFLARGQAQVYAGDCSSGTALDAARVVALDDAEVTAEGAAIIRAADRARVNAGGAAYVEATGRARVHAGPHVVVRRYGTDCLITGSGTVVDTSALDAPGLDLFHLPALMPWWAPKVGTLPHEGGQP